MKTGQALACAATGILVGTGAYLLKVDADRANQALENRQRESYEACLDWNSTVQDLNIEDALRDCDAEYLE